MGIVSPHDFYVYTLYRNGIPFYVGKGSNGRIDAHEMCARNRDKCPHQTCRVIRKIWRTGETLTKSKVCEEVSEKTAFKIEKLMISIGWASGWPLVNLTTGGEGASGYRWTHEQREARKIRAMRDIANIERIKTINVGRKHTEETRKKRGQRLKTAWSNPELREQKRQVTQQLWDSGEMREKQRAGFDRPEVREKMRQSHLGQEPANTKTYPGFIAPDGTIYKDVHNLTKFAREHGIEPANLRDVVYGKQRSCKGWRCYPEDTYKTKPTYHGPGFVSPDGVVYQDILSLTDFCKEHDLSLKCMSLVARGKNHSHKGWKRFDC